MSNKGLKSKKHIELNAVIRQSYPRAYQVFTPYALPCICVKKYFFIQNYSVLDFLNCKIFEKKGFCCILKIRIIIGSAGFELFTCKYMHESKITLDLHPSALRYWGNNGFYWGKIIYLYLILLNISIGSMSQYASLNFLNKVNNI